MTSEELVIEIQRLIQDDDYSVIDILLLLNRAIDHITTYEMWELTQEGWPTGKILFPALNTTSTRLTVAGTSYVDLPTDYMRELYFIGYANQRQVVNIKSNLVALMRDWTPAMDAEGNQVEDVCIWQGRIYFQPIPPEDTELTFYYYQLPTYLITDDSDVGYLADSPTFMPERFHQGLCDWVMWKIWEEKTQFNVDESKNPNTNYLTRVTDYYRRTQVWCWNNGMTTTVRDTKRSFRSRFF